ncbi:MAG: bifunctional UDP-N-acetylglucosamine diphosphorylase/glucosamine-1-phosphate N-acetyltransferase GlmU [Myxococcales bacterium]
MERIAAVVLAAGKGTRMKSDRAKVLHEACGRPIAYFPIRAALAQGSSPVVVVVGHQADAVQKTLSTLFTTAPIEFALQAEQLGTGHAVLSAEAALRKAGFGDRGSVLIVAGDVPLITAETLQRLVQAKAESKAPLALLTTHVAEPRGYGRIVRNPKGGIERIVEEKDATPEERRIKEVNASIYICDAGFLFAALSRTGRSNAQGEYYLTDIVAAAAALAKEGRAAWPASVEASEDEVSGVNDRAQLAASAATLRERRLVQLMKEGVTVVDPRTTFLDEGVEVGVDSVLEPMVSLRGKTKLGKNVEVGQGSILVDVEVEDGARILPYCHMTESKIGKGAVLGPFARLRPLADVRENAHVGNFVELKKTVLGKGSKANHLSYLGDAVIGEGCNIGAGTITCNYDGANKYVTTIEDGAFVGSDTQLIAPITVKKGAYVGTGTTVREDVPPGSLAVSAGKQRNIEGWVEKKAPKKATGKKTG